VYNELYSSGGIGNNARVRFRAAFTGGGSGYGGSFQLETRQAGNAWNTGALTVTDAGNVSTTGNLIIGTSGKGIDFSAAAGTGTSELLADYEEGLHTATIALQTSGSVTLKTANNTLQYVKVGNIVTVTGLLVVDSVSSPTGYMEVSLPFTCANLTNTAGVSAVTFMVGGAVSTAVNGFRAVVNEAAAAIRVFVISGTGVSLASGQQMQANTEIYLSATYRTA
jgi:hypothetical protein